jgi:small conductance mechanosensitive channel
MQPLPYFESLATELIRQSKVFLPTAGVSLLVLLAFWIGGSILQRIIKHLGHRARLDQDVITLLGKSAGVAVTVFGVVTALGTLGIDVSALVAGLGLTGFALGFAFKDALSNLLAGIMILIYRPFRRNNRISVAGFEGRVIEINLRYTVLDAQEKRILIPNSTLFTNVVALLEMKKNENRTSGTPL